MTHQQAIAAAATITAAAIDQLAKTHNCSADQVVIAISEGHVKLSRQFAELCSLGLSAV